MNAEDAVRALTASGRTVATAESLTGGLVCAALTSVPGSSAVVRGGVIVYATQLKSSLAGVPGELLDRHGPVAPEVAAAMADGVRHRLGADVGVATTGVAGPSGQDGHPPGTVHVAVATSQGTTVRSYTGDSALTGGRGEVRDATVRAALELLSGL
ncbi:CinA family protein [Jiangella gansuensis]|uniref:CinA family protein n=1 Tax=Jiangella gansuensis TaxID=281473 RepID=UPI00047B154F|nr:CinA family protein [Jiangella gansuensis]